METIASYSNKSFPRDKNDKSVSFTGSVLSRMWPDECFDRIFFFHAGAGVKRRGSEAQVGQFTDRILGLYSF